MAKIKCGDKVVYHFQGLRDHYYIVDRVCYSFSDGKLYLQCHDSCGRHYCYPYDNFIKVEG